MYVFFIVYVFECRVLSLWHVDSNLKPFVCRSIRRVENSKVQLSDVVRICWPRREHLQQNSVNACNLHISTIHGSIICYLCSRHYDSGAIEVAWFQLAYLLQIFSEFEQIYVWVALFKQQLHCSQVGYFDKIMMQIINKTIIIISITMRAFSTNSQFLFFEIFSMSQFCFFFASPLRPNGHQLENNCKISLICFNFLNNQY